MRARTLAAVALLVILPAKARAQDDTRAALAKTFGEVATFLEKSAELVDDAKYSQRPTASVRTYLQLIAHVADGNRWYCTGATTGKMPQWSDATEKTAKTKAEVVKALKDSNAACRAAYSAAGSSVAPLIENIGHANLHYGNVITYLRVMGLTPPSS